jgi:hypothetical protein
MPYLGARKSENRASPEVAGFIESSFIPSHKNVPKKTNVSERFAFPQGHGPLH